MKGAVRNKQTPNGGRKPPKHKHTMKNQFEISHSEASPLLEGMFAPVAEGQSVIIERTHLTIEGYVSKGEATDKAATCNALSLALVGELLARAGATREAAIQLMLDAASGTLVASPTGKGWAEEAKTRIAAECPRTPVAGRRTGTILVTVG